MANYINLNELSITTQALLKKINEQADLKVDKDEVVQNTQSGNVIATVGDVDIYNGVDLGSLYDAIPQYTSDLTNDSGFITIDHSHGHITSAGAITDTGVALTSGDSLVFSDASDSGKLRKTSITFDGTNTKQFLSKKGTFESVTALTATSASNNTEYELIGLSQGGQDPKTVINCGMATVAKYTGNYARLTLGTSTTDGVLRLYNNGTTDLKATEATGSRTIFLPSSEGTLALTSDIPTKVSDLTNDSGYQTQSEVNTLIGTAIGNINQFNVAIVQTLPTTDIDAHTIYFVPQQNAQTANSYEEWMYINSQWEMIGTTSIDLSGYVPQFLVTLTYDAQNDVWSSDKTYAQISTALANGYDVLLYDGNHYYPYQSTGFAYSDRVSAHNFYTIGSDFNGSSVRQYGYWVGNGYIGVIDITYDPDIPTATSDLTNDSGFITSADIPVTDVQNSSGTSLVSNGVATIPAIPTVPTNVSSFTNDAGYLTLSTLPIYDGSVS